MNTSNLVFMVLLFVFVGCQDTQFNNFTAENGDSLVVSESGNNNEGTSNGSNGSESNGSESNTERTIIDVVDTFEQVADYNKKVDILWVIDNSGSMKDEQENIAANFDVFINDFVKKEFDFQMGITTTDVTAAFAGKAIGDFSMLDSAAALNDEEAFKTYFKESIQVGTSGSGNEKAFQGFLNFFEGDGQLWQRSDAQLAVIIVSDEQEQSVGMVQTYVDYLAKLKENNNLFTVNTIEKNPSPDSRFTKISTLTGGLNADIDNNFATTLDNLQFSILKLLGSFALSKEPIENHVEVFVNSEKVLANWTFDAQKKTVSFDEMHEPAPGSTIEVHYKTYSN